MGKKLTARRKARRGHPRRAAVRFEVHGSSLTAVAAEAIRRGGTLSTGVRRHNDLEEIPHEGRALRCGDPDESVLGAEYVGDEVPGGSTPTPDQSLVDEIGRAYGLTDEDSGALRTSAEILARRDRRRQELSAPKAPKR
jgi:hypothetical protein